MAQITLRIHRMLSEGAEVESPGLEEIPVSFSVGENLEHVVRRLATDNNTLGDALYGTSGQTIRGGILVVFNDRIINRSEYAAVAPQDGDEVTFLPMLDGG